MAVFTSSGAGSDIIMSLLAKGHGDGREPSSPRSALWPPPADSFSGSQITRGKPGEAPGETPEGGGKRGCPLPPAVKAIKRLNTHFDCFYFAGN